MIVQLAAPTPDSPRGIKGVIQYENASQQQEDTAGEPASAKRDGSSKESTKLEHQALRPATGHSIETRQARVSL